MPRTIEVLPDLVANQIAAGEVVERPASVVKELIENALDARATRIDIDIERGGKGRIRVTDDGVGMGREDALLSLDRHATSKIRAATDLQSVGTFGFRGEALPSIAAVSRMTLETRGASDPLGTRVRVKGGTITEVDDVPRRRGTTVEVSNVFFNAPARSKFLKAVGAEARAVSDVVSVLALANASVGFGLTSGGTDPARAASSGGSDDPCSRPLGEGSGHHASRSFDRTRRHPGARSDPTARCGQEWISARPPLCERETLSQPSPAGGRRSGVSHHDSGAGSTVGIPLLHMPPGTVDMNVHPAKAEVRFRDAAAVESLIEEAVRTGLTSEASAATLDTQLESPRLMVREPSPPRADKSDAESQTALFLSADAGVEPIPVVEERPRLWQVLEHLRPRGDARGSDHHRPALCPRAYPIRAPEPCLRGERADRPKAPLPAHHSPLQSRVRAGGSPDRHPQPCGL